MNHSLEGGWLEQRELGVGGGQRRQREEYHVGPWKGLVRHFGLPWWLSSKESVCNAGDAGDTGDTFQSLGREDPLEASMATHSSILARKIPMDRRAWWAMVHGFPKSGHNCSS